jgi:hypothetical protein
MRENWMKALTCLLAMPQSVADLLFLSEKVSVPTLWYANDQVLTQPEAACHISIPV